jgi:hypothetical protein
VTPEQKDTYRLGICFMLFCVAVYFVVGNRGKDWLWFMGSMAPFVLGFFLLEYGVNGK